MNKVEESLVEREERLSDAQEVALAALKGGQTFGRAAEEARVSRMTVYRWLRGDPRFRAAYNAWQQEAAESARARLVKLADKAVDVVEQALDRDDEKVALKVLHGVGVLRKRRAGSTNAEVLRLQMELGEKQELRRAEMAMLQYLLEKAGVPPEQQQRVLAGGSEAAEFLAKVRRESPRRAGAAENQTKGIGSNQIVPKPVTSTEGGLGAAAEAAAADEECNDNEYNDLEMELT